MKHYEAPWSTSLIVTSVLTTVLCLGVTAGTWLNLAGMHPPGTLGYIMTLPLGILFGTALFTIRGYSISSDSILVHRLLWSTVLPRAGLEWAQVEPDAMRGSLRTFGNGGAFSFTGFYLCRPDKLTRVWPVKLILAGAARKRVFLFPGSG